MNLKKADREKVITLIEKYGEAFKWCFNREYTNGYIEHFGLMKFNSACYNGDLILLKLDIFKENNITDIYEGIPNKEVEEAVRTFFIKEFKKHMKTILPIHFQEQDKLKKAEREKEKELKAKK